MNENQTKCDLLQSKLNQALKKISDFEKMHEKVGDQTILDLKVNYCETN